MNNQKGFGIVEIIVALAFIAFISLSLGRTLNALNRANSLATDKTKALAFAQESLELMLDLQNDFFACQCDHDVCNTNSCQRASDSQSCTRFPAYTSCWTAYPVGQLNQNRFYLNEDYPGHWQLVNLLPGQMQIYSTDTKFSRVIEITNAYRDIDGDLASSGTMDPNTKNVAVTVSWQERGATHTSQASVILTAWKNL